MRDFNAIDAEAQPRNVTAWTPVITEVIAGCCRFEDDSVSPSDSTPLLLFALTFLPGNQFKEYLPQLYPLITDMLAREMAVELWQAVRGFYIRVGQVQNLIK
jgi:brefeldin A-inhibited guanine nucleotide-exchange protein